MNRIIAAAASFFSALGIGDDPTALGTLVPPYPATDRFDDEGRAA